MEELKEQINNILDSLKEVTQENTRNTILELIMKEIHKYDNSLSMSFDALSEENIVLKEEKKIVINRNVEMQRKLECIEYIIGGRQ